MRDNFIIRTMVRGTYDLQKLRIQTGNRIVMNYKSKMGQAPGVSEEDADLAPENVNILNELRTQYDKITDGYVRLPSRRTFDGDALISDYTELCLLSQYFELEKNESRNFKQLEKALEDFPIYTEFLKGVRGCGPAMAGVIISEIDISKAKYASSLHMYCGLDVAQDGKGRSKRKEHLREVKYLDAAGKENTKLGITFKPWLKSKLIGVLATSFLRTGSPYAKVYYDYKHRLECHPVHCTKTKGHIHNMCMRYMIKIFLIDLYAKWRELEGLEVHPPYHEAKLGLKHGSEGGV